MGFNIVLGILLVLSGLSMLAKVFFKWDFPVFKVFIALLLIIFGAKMLTSRGDFYYRFDSNHRDDVD